MQPPYPDRYFIALSIPKPLQEKLFQLSSGIEGAKWNREKDYHITLRYLDILEPNQIDPIAERLASIRKSPFGVEVSGFDVFDNPKQKILWAKILSTRKLTSLVGDVNEKLHSLGFEMPSKPYVPHITMARAKQLKVVQSYIAKNSKRLQYSWQAEEFLFLKSTRYGAMEEAVPKDYVCISRVNLRKF
jgi:2'-5' RNA ligase